MPASRIRRTARRRMSLVAWTCMLAACGDRAAPGGPAPATLDQPEVHLVWQGVLACADCGGIDTRLRLDRGAGARAHYQLVEAYLQGDDAEYFRDEGQWQREGRVLTLRSAAGAVRHYRLDDAGNLQAAGRDGAPMGGRALAPLPPDPS